MGDAVAEAGQLSIHLLVGSADDSWHVSAQGIDDFLFVAVVEATILPGKLVHRIEGALQSTFFLGGPILGDPIHGGLKNFVVGCLDRGML